jgi:hypothetical protein
MKRYPITPFKHLEKRFDWRIFQVPLPNRHYAKREEYNQNWMRRILSKRESP